MRRRYAPELDLEPSTRRAVRRDRQGVGEDRAAGAAARRPGKPRALARTSAPEPARRPLNADVRRPRPSAARPPCPPAGTALIRRLPARRPHVVLSFRDGCSVLDPSRRDRDLAFRRWLTAADAGSAQPAPLRHRPKPSYLTNGALLPTHRVKQLGDILLEGGLVDPRAVAHRRRGAAPARPQPRPGAGRPRHGHRVPAGRRARRSRSAFRSSTSRDYPVDASAVASVAPHVAPPAHRAAHRLRGRPARRRHGRPGQRLRPRRHPLAHRPRRQAGRRHQGRPARGDRPLPPQRRRARRPHPHPRAPTTTTTTLGPRSRRSSTTRRSSSSSTCSSPRPCRTGPPTSTSSRRSATCGSASASTACCTRSCARRRSIQAGVISRLKIMAEIDIAERRVPQDGRLSVSVGGKKIDLRVATLPTVWGEKIVMRILDNSTAMLKLSDLGFRDSNYERWKESSPSRTGCSWSPGRPAPASRRRCTRR